MKRIRLLPLIFCLCLALGLFTGCAAGSAISTAPASSAAASSALPSDAHVPPIENDGTDHLTTAASYDDVFKALKDAETHPTYGGAYTVRDGAAEAGHSMSGAQTNSAAPVPAPLSGDAQSSTAAQGPAYSQTNVQVEGVDEGDIVKTDGAYIYVLRQNELIIFNAAGATTSRLSSLKVGIGDTMNKPYAPAGSKAPETIASASEYASDIYVTGNTAVVLTSYSNYGPYPVDSSAKTDIAPVFSNKQIAKVYMIDITDRSNPVLKEELGQDGNVLTSRLVGSTLYLISNYYVYNVQEGDSGTYVPRLYAGTASTAVSYKSISIMPYLNSSAYTVVCAYDLEKGVLQANASLLGGGTTVYMNKETLVIANSTNKQTAGTPYTDSVYSVVDYSMASITELASFELSGGGLQLKASGSVPGSLYGQFALDAYNGSLRVVTTTFSQRWSEYTDKAKGFVNDVWKDPSNANTLTVLDGNLNVIGSIGDLAPGEQVYSVRFDGPTGYIVTFRQVDPLFAVNLTDPTKPTVTSALKIPGFSEYLHVYSDGRLLGLGMDADAKSGRTNGMKLTMFDTTNPDDVTVKNSLKLDSDWSAALNNHKAILISADKSIIAFPADNGYDIYGYSDEQGFYKRASISALEWSGDSRGLTIGDIAYIVDSASISILDMTGFTLLNRISY